MKSLRETREKEVREMLIAEQQYDAWQKKRNSRQAQHKTGRGGKRESR